MKRWIHAATKPAIGVEFTSKQLADFLEDEGWSEDQAAYFISQYSEAELNSMSRSKLRKLLAEEINMNEGADNADEISSMLVSDFKKYLQGEPYKYDRRADITTQTINNLKRRKRQIKKQLEKTVDDDPNLGWFLEADAEGLLDAEYDMEHLEELIEDSDNASIFRGRDRWSVEELADCLRKFGADESQLDTFYTWMIRNR